ncbi:MAG TPA: alcohol dehydrogenase catalytic domain-containing protein [Rhizomicrobium sp.]|nr:alcohol dehydrogenase catalytic domain-containing protein [Rhizomicrobium sp.]
MKAAVFRALDRPLSIENIVDPKPRADEIVVKVGRCGICGSDLHMTREPIFGLQPGAVLGHEFAGEIIEIGKNVERLKVGDRVAVAPLRGCGHCASCLAGEPSWCSRMTLQGGGYAEYAAATERQCRKFPDSVSLADGALVEPLAVALHGVALSGLKAGARVLVMGAGPIGIGVAFWARRLGAGRVVLSDLHDAHSALAREVGAHFVKVNGDAVENVREALGGPPEIVFECVGAAGILAQTLEHVAPRGTIVMLGLCTSPDSFIPFAAVQKEVRFQTSAFFTLREFQAVLDMFEREQGPRAMVTDTVSLPAMPDAFEALRRRTHQCKVMVRP